MICCSCGQNTLDQDICELCQEWGVTNSEVFPTLSDVLSEQFHRIGKNGTKYWGQLGAGIVFTDGKKILLLKRDESSDYAGHWCIPGGKAKKGETPIDVAHRESKEECGNVEGQQFEHFHAKDGAHHFHTYLMAISKPFDVKLSKEHTDSDWVDLDKVENMKLHPKFKDAWPGHLRAIKRRFPNKTNFSEWFVLRNSKQ